MKVSRSTVPCVQLYTFVSYMLGNTTIFLLVALAAERYVAVVHPLTVQKRRVSPRTYGVLCVLLTWMIATLLAVPDAFAARGMEDLVFTARDTCVFALLQLRMHVHVQETQQKNCRTM